MVAQLLLMTSHSPSDNAENMYYFSGLALTLNELEEGVGLTDSRLRPDQKLMEEGRWDEANAEKQRLEEKQRAVRRRREAEASDAINDGMEQRTGRVGREQKGCMMGLFGISSRQIYRICVRACVTISDVPVTCLSSPPSVGCQSVIMTLVSGGCPATLYCPSP